MDQLAQSGNAVILGNLAGAYRATMTDIADHLDNLTNQGQNVSDLASTIDQETAKHTLVLEEVALKAPDSAQNQISTAIASSETVADTVADALDRPPLPAEVIDRLQALKAQGLLTQEEVSNLVAVDSRRQARNKLREYTQARLLPESDFSKLNETARALFPQAYNTNVELKKFHELKDLETQKPDDATLTQIQQFAQDYQPGDIIPSQLRRWWVPLIRLEELQHTLRPDLIPQDSFRFRPEDQQKYTEIIERSKPRQQDIEYVNHLISQNPNLLSDPAYARIVAIGAKFGAAADTTTSTPTSQTCNGNTHWVTIPFMPQGGYCVPNYTYPAPSQTISDTPCPPDYHRNSPGSACYPDNPNGPGINSLPARGTCPSGYRWAGSYCSPEYFSSGTYPSPTSTPSYCPSGQYFGPGGVCTDSSKSEAAYDCSRAGKYWNGNSCQPAFPTPSSTSTGPYAPYSPYSSTPTCQPPSGGCGANSWYDWGSCSCKTSWTPSASNRDQQEAVCRAGGGTCTWNNDVCNCQGSHSSSTTTSGSCGSGYYWNGSYCTPSTSTTTPTSTSTNMSREQQQAGCSSCGGTCSWNGDSCNCQCAGSSSSGSSGSSTSTSTPPQPTEQPTSTSESSQPAPANTSTMDPATACAQTSGCSWSDGGCHCP